LIVTFPAIDVAIQDVDGLCAEAAISGRAAPVGRVACGGASNRESGHGAAALGSLAIGVIVGRDSEHRALFLVLAIWLVARMGLNAIDGMLAREFGQKSRLGAYLNEIGDLVSDAALYAPFALVAPFGAFGVGSVIVLAIISEFAGALGPTIGAARRYDGPMGKSDRAVVFGAVALWLGVGGSLPEWVGLLMPLLAGLLMLTIANRVRMGLAEAAEPEAPSPAATAAAVAATARPVEEKTFRVHDGVELAILSFTYPK
jgi:CDP-diacylglycerol--glycerol-3-phosphate 3-phosphatidyltransferase